MLNEGRSLGEIATLRQRQLGTVVNTVAALVEQGDVAFNDKWVDATRRGRVTGPSVWDGYAASAVAEAGVRSLRGGGRVAVELAARPELYAGATG